MKVIFSLLLFTLYSLDCEAQLVPFSYTTTSTKSTTFDTSQISNLITTFSKQVDSVLAKLKEKIKGKNNVSSYSKGAEAAMVTAARTKVKIEEDFSALSDQLIAAINASPDIKVRNERRKELKDARVNRKELIKGIYKDMVDFAKELHYWHLNDSRFRLFPVRNAVGAQLFYENELSDGRSNFLRNTLVRYSPDGGKASIFNEVFSDYAGAFRIGIGMLISNKASTNGVSATKSEKDAIQRLIGGGGNFVINAGYPIAGYSSQFDNFSTKLAFVPKLNIDVPQLGTEATETAVSSDIGVEGSMYYTFKNEVVTVFSNFRLGYLLGNKNFYSNLGKDDAQGFAFHQISTGIALKSTFRLSWNVFFGDQFVKSNFNQSIGFSIVPN